MFTDIRDDRAGISDAYHPRRARPARLLRCPQARERPLMRVHCVPAAMLQIRSFMA
jgi:hypothetical protein